MPIYIYKCSACKSLITQELPRKRKTIMDQCNALPGGRKKVRMTYVRTLSKRAC